MCAEKYPERRSHTRVKASFIVTYKINEPLHVTITINKREIPALMVDLSEGGMAIVTEYEIPASTTLLINFTLINIALKNDSERIRTMDLLGEVRYQIPLKRNERRLGIYFTKIEEEDKTAIKKFVEAVKTTP
jgi:c-di-GMP-binding flagellar brake protein YcgR